MTSALNAKTALIARIQAIPDISDYTVTWSMPKVPQNKWVMVGKIAYQATAWKTNMRYEEAYEIDVIVNSVLPAGTPQDAETEVVRVQSLIWAAITAEPTFNGLAVSSIPAAEHVVSWPAPNGVEGQASGRVAITARQAR